VQILVVVAIIQMRTLKAEVEKVSMRTAIGHGLLGPKILVKTLQLSFGSQSKGNGVNIPQAGYGCHGNVCELSNTSTCLWESYLFLF
jgi:hypothetical protein